MNFTDLFDSQDKKKRLSHIRNLVALSCADGKLEEAELELIIRIGLNAGLTRDELNRVVSRPDSISFSLPENSRDRIEQLYDMVMVMMVDGDIDQNEIVFCKITAKRLGLRPEIIDRMVIDTIDFIVKGIAIENAIDHLLRTA